MPTLASIVVAALVGGVLSTVIAGFTLALDPKWIPRLVSFAIGALLGAVFLEIVPHALEAGDAHGVMVVMLAGLLGFFVLEKLVIWRHSHGHDQHVDAREESEHDHALHGIDEGRSGLMILIGNSVHSFCDGIVIAAAFLAGDALGYAATLAIVAHALPQQVGDFAVLVNSGYTRRRAFTVNVTTGLATLAGALVAYFALAGMTQALPIVLALAGASLLYVAVADLIPSLHRRSEPLQTVGQSLLIAAGVGVIAAVHALLPH
ncbi:MAG: ZIP family metal transporter [Betaproteobacteria bacterium]